MNRTTQGPTKRLAAVVGASVMAFALVAPSVAEAAPSTFTPNLSKAPSEADWMDLNFGTPGVKAVASVPGVDINRTNPDVPNTVVGGQDIPVRITTKGFSKGALSVWIQSYGNAWGVGRTPWRKFTVNPDKNGVVNVTVKPAKADHCSAVFIRINDKAGNWTEEGFGLMVIEEECENCTPAQW